MSRLDYLFAIDRFPPNTLPLLDDYHGETRIYGLMVETRADLRTRADVLEYPGRWKIAETELPGGMPMSREWHYSKYHTSLEEVIEHARTWGCDPQSAPAGWFREVIIGRPERWGAHWAKDHLNRMGRNRGAHLSVSPACFTPLQLTPASQQEDDGQEERMP